MSTFHELGLSEHIIKAITGLGYKEPTPIQSKAIPHVLTTKTDLIALAQTGTGKTAAFGLPIINNIDITSAQTQSIILCPTRELCLQISRDLTSYSSQINGLKVTAVYGGTSIDAQIRALDRGSQIVVGTPGRVVDLILRKRLKLQNIEWLVLDEADEMLSMGFKDDLDTILNETPKKKQTLLFSATMPLGIQKITKQYMTHPTTIEIAKRNTGNVDVDHEFYMVSAKDRYLALKRLADMNPNIFGIVFCRTRRETKEVAEKLMKDGYNADALHGDLSQSQRDYVMGRFRNKVLQILVATDVAARGLDVNNLTHVINYNLPDDTEVYVHRSGRTGRAGNKGKSITIIHTREMRRIKDLERMIGRKFQQKKVPTGNEICSVQLLNLIDNIKKIEVNEEQINPFMPAVLEKLGHMDKDDLIKHFVSAEFNRFLDYYKNARDLNDIKSSKRTSEQTGSKVKRNSKHDRYKKRRNIHFARFFINAGKANRLTPQRLMGMINDYETLDGVEIGQIEIQNNFSFFEVDKEAANDVLEAFKGKDLDGLKLLVEPSLEMKGSLKERNKRKNQRSHKTLTDSHRERARAKTKNDYRKKSSDLKKKSKLFPEIPSNKISSTKRRRNRKW